MIRITRSLLVTFLATSTLLLNAQIFKISSPDGNLNVNIENLEQLQYAVTFKQNYIIETSQLGFEFKNEAKMVGNFKVISDDITEKNESWRPVVKLKCDVVKDNYNQLILKLQEKDNLMRKMDLQIRAYNDGVAFRYKLFRSENVGTRIIDKELTTFNIPGNPKTWTADYGSYTSSQEEEFIETKVNNIDENSIIGLPLLIDFESNCAVAITEANIDDYAAFYIGTNGSQNNLTTKLSPIPNGNNDKVRFTDDIYTPWRVIMVGDSPGKLIESNIIQNLNEPCEITDPSWIIPGKSAWDNWWSGDVKMEMSVIKEYIDFASTMEWNYMLVDWQWYGQFNKPTADILTWAPQIKMPEIIEYAAQQNVKIILWLYSKDVNRNSAYKKAFPLYKEWGIAGVKIDFMERDDQEMVNWYQDIIKCAANNQLLVDFHGAYKPDGIIRTYPNMITREGVLGNEYYKFSEKMSPEHNVKLAFTRMLAGPLDYTPGGFLNVTKDQYKNALPTLVWNTRCAELAKFVVYESPLTVVCDHPKNILGQPGADFIKEVPTVWDETKFIGGYPAEYVAIARRNGDKWYIGILNNQVRKKVELSLDFLSPGKFNIEQWTDHKKSDTDATLLKKKFKTVSSESILKIDLAMNGGFVAIIEID